MQDDRLKALQELIGNDIRSPDDEQRDAFFSHFAAEAREFADHTATALLGWSVLFDSLTPDDEKKGVVAALLFTAINLHCSSFKLFMTGHMVAAGATFRQVLEAIALVFLCSAKRLTVLDAFMADRYQSNKAIIHLGREIAATGVNPDAYRVLNEAYRFFHRYAHPTKLTVAAVANFSAGIRPHIGALFDPAKINEYGKEVRGRVSLARVLPNFVEGIEANLAKW